MKHLLDHSGLADHFFIDSAGTGAYHVGEPADARSASAALRQGITLTSISRQFTPQDFADFDYIVAMDRKNFAHLQRLTSSPTDRDKLSLLRSYEAGAAAASLDVPDPYFEDNFDGVFEICKTGCVGLLAHIAKERGLAL